MWLLSISVGGIYILVVVVSNGWIPIHILKILVQIILENCNNMIINQTIIRLNKNMLRSDFMSLINDVIIDEIIPLMSLNYVVIF